jgi:hypothetical protein
MAQQPSFFYATRLAFWHPDKYRIYVLPEELLFLRVGLSRNEEREEKRLDEADLDELRRLASGDPGSFVATVSELAGLRLGPPRRQRFAPFIYLLVPPNEHQAELCFSHAARGKYRLALFYPNAEKATRELTKALACSTRYTPPPPWWARVVLATIGLLILVAAGLLSTWGVGRFFGAPSWDKGVRLLLLLGFAGAMFVTAVACFLIAFTREPRVGRTGSAAGKDQGHPLSDNRPDTRSGDMRPRTGN